MALSGKSMALTSDSELSHSYLAKEREKTTTAYHHHGRRVCRNTFLFLHGVGSCRLKAIKSHYLANGLVPRRHGNTGRVPSNALSLEDVQHVVHFILHYAEANAHRELQVLKVTRVVRCGLTRTPSCHYSNHT